MSHEKSATFEVDGRDILLRTVVDGKQRTPDEAFDLFRRGKNPAMGTFRNKKELKAAQQIFSDTDKVPFPKRKPDRNSPIGTTFKRSLKR